MALNLKGKRLAVVGSRDFADKQRLYEVLTKNLPNIKMIVSGGARGADTLAVQWAADYGVPYLVFPALWRDPQTLQHDRGAGFRRNRYIVTYSDVVMAFWDGKSSGTASTIEMAKEVGKPVKIITFIPTPPPTKVKEAESAVAVAHDARQAEEALRKESDKNLRDAANYVAAEQPTKVIPEGKDALCCSQPTCENKEPLEKPLIDLDTL